MNMGEINSPSYTTSRTSTDRPLLLSTSFKTPPRADEEDVDNTYEDREDKKVGLGPQDSMRRPPPEVPRAPPTPDWTARTSACIVTSDPMGAKTAASSVDADEKMLPVTPCRASAGRITMAFEAEAYQIILTAYKKRAKQSVF
eukprot:CAMPEP_0185797162 /NCGR_PEP_ID=MMETSP1174-20130828/161471_1 /TAXON_ID=35687 /ORGANISM="Dictyocha speculum, Strain CCMP1381" /LENGTH=142 /DNA_ID=CAMNT_0028492583 /DNA_START=76 /DNA_END=505 /DNA_ORIENTATION=+